MSCLDHRDHEHEEWWSIDSARRALKMQDRSDDPSDPWKRPEECRRVALYFWNEALKYGRLEVC